MRFAIPGLSPRCGRVYSTAAALVVALCLSACSSPLEPLGGARPRSGPPGERTPVNATNFRMAGLSLTLMPTERAAHA